MPNNFVNYASHAVNPTFLPNSSSYLIAPTPDYSAFKKGSNEYRENSFNLRIIIGCKQRRRPFARTPGNRADKIASLSGRDVAGDKRFFSNIHSPARGSFHAFLSRANFTGLPALSAD